MVHRGGSFVVPLYLSIIGIWELKDFCVIACIYIVDVDREYCKIEGRLQSGNVLGRGGEHVNISFQHTLPSHVISVGEF